MLNILLLNIALCWAVLENCPCVAERAGDIAENSEKRQWWRLRSSVGIRMASGMFWHEHGQNGGLQLECSPALEECADSFHDAETGHRGYG